MSDKMDIREYKNYAQGTHGKGTINEGMLKAMDRATGGKKLSKSEWNDMNAKIKIKGAEMEG